MYFKVFCLNCAIIIIISIYYITPSKCDQNKPQFFIKKNIISAPGNTIVKQTNFCTRRQRWNVS